MKNRIFYLFFICFLVLSNPSFGNINTSGGIVIDIILDKNSTPVVTFQISENHLDKRGELLLLEITIYKGERTVLSSTHFEYSSGITLPLLAPGVYYIELSIGSSSTIHRFTI